MAIKLYDLTNIKSPSGTFSEIVKILSLIDPDYNTSQFEMAYNDIICLFNGEYPGYRASNTKYHNLEHTCAVTLAVTRLIHGLHVQGNNFSSRVIELGLISSLFHDTGLIQKTEEDEGTGAKYTIGHEERSIELMGNYLASNDFSTEDITDCRHIIMCTILTLPFEEIPFKSDEIGTIGRILGSADLIAQMADRNYLEKLPLLFLEFEEAKMPGFETPLELFKKTEEFYHSVARTRLAKEMGDVSAAALFHFKERWDIDRDLYAESITNNLKYMKEIYEDCNESFDCLLKRIRRKN
ncbi:MAG: hypothetical protein JSW69_00540 [Deltaproteobacteria bacterium]|nr:MAG: hypothetical protein JSW69_00540 [Deltaproteobacteria bacterium]